REIGINADVSQDSELGRNSEYHTAVEFLMSFVRTHLRRHLRSLETSVKQKPKTTGLLFKAQEAHRVYNTFGADRPHLHFKRETLRTFQVFKFVVCNAETDTEFRT